MAQQFLSGVRSFLFGKGATSGQDEGGRQQSAAPDSDYTHREPAYSQASRESGQKRARPGSRSSGAAAQAPSGPVLQEVGPSRSGGLQGLGWYTASLQTDADGDTAHAFYKERSAGGHGSSSSVGSGSGGLQQDAAARQASRQQSKLRGVQQGSVVHASSGT